MMQHTRPGTLVQPFHRIDKDQIKSLHEASLSILDDPGITCFNENAAQRLGRAGCQISAINKGSEAWRVRIPPKIIEQSLETAPQKIVLGARDPENTLVLDSSVPSVHFGTGSEANIYLETEMEEFVKKDDPSVVKSYPVFKQERGTVGYLCRSAKLCNQLDQVDFFIRNVNIQDEGISPNNKDVNVFLASLMYMTKHVQAGLTDIDRLDDILKLTEMIAGGPENFKKNPIISFITCLIKSPLQMVNDTAEKLMAIAERGLPVVISSSPQGGSTAPIQEEGMVALINAEILAGITLAQVVNPGTPVLYGAVPVRARLDTLHDLYGAPEFIHYNIDCVQMARHYGIPCYSTAGAGDAKVPGLQATVEKLFSQLQVASSGAQYIHYAFGLLDKTNVFSPLQAVLDDAHIGIIRQILRQPRFGRKEAENAVEEIRKISQSRTQLFARLIRKWIKKGVVSLPYPFESRDGEDRVLEKAYERLQNILKGPDEKLPDDLIQKIYKEIPGLLPVHLFELTEKQNQEG
jgi:trimethylamine--corrinoid protein Co-methyltransferase